MGRYDSIKQKAAHLLAKMDPVSGESLHQTRLIQGIPSDYMDFLAEIGWGEIIGSVMVYSGLIEPDEIFDPETAKSLNGILLWGSAGQGDCYGFDTRNGWQAGVVDHVDGTFSELSESFELYITSRIEYALIHYQE